MSLLGAHPIDLASPSRQQLLRFRLQTDLAAAIAIDRVTELVNIPLDRVVPMPHLPPTVMGVYNWRGEILWIVDFMALLGLNAHRSSSLRQDRSLQPTIVLTHPSASGEQMVLGLVVNAIDEIEWCQPDLLRSISSDSLQAELATWTKGYWRSATGEELIVFDGQAIFERAELHANI